MEGHAASRHAFGAWWAQGVRSALLLRPRWQGLVATPAIVTVLFAVALIASIVGERFFVEGAAVFYWPALLGAGWSTTAASAFACWFLGTSTRTGEGAPGGAAVFALLCAQALPLGVLCLAVLLPLTLDGTFIDTMIGATHRARAAQAAWLAGAAYVALAQALLLWRVPGAPRARRLLAAAIVVAAGAAEQAGAPLRHWYPAPVQNEASAFRLTQEVFEAQARRLDHDLAALARQQPGVVDVYAITFAPDADAPVFARESALVASVMGERFGAAGKTVQLVNQRSANPSAAWATPLNLQRAIAHVATLMDRDEDVLFIHLTSHGARNGELAPAFAPLDVDPVTPQALRRWLDEAGIRHRVVSVSACFSGSWIAPLAGDDTLVMTAADSTHTSYGCGRLSPLTFFGRAMYDEALRHTWSFEQALAQAREVIRRREREAGKDDGYSNPQIAVGPRIRAKLAELEAQRAAAAR